MGSIGKLSGAVAAIGAPVGLGAGLAKAVSIGSEFQREMSNVQAFVGGTAQDFQKLSDLAESLGASTAFTASQAAQAMAEMGKAGLSASQIIGASEGVLTLAAAGDIEMAEAATIAAAALNQFQIPATQMPSVVDQLAKAASSGAISLSGMGTQLSYAASSATAFGLDLGETAGMIATLATTLGEDKAGTAFRAMMTSLQAPTALAAETMEELGVSVTDAAGNFLEPAAIISQFDAALDGMSAGDKAAKLNQIFNTRGLPAFTTFLKQGADGMREMTQAVVDSDGFGLATANTKLNNVSGAFEKLKSAASAMAIDVFQSFQGPLQSALEGSADFILNSMIPAFRESMDWLGAFAKVAEFAWNNFAELAGLATLKALSAFTTLSEDVQHFFGTNMGELTEWLFKNWSTIWTDMAAATFGVLDNIGQNVKNMFSAVWETVTSLGETPLTFDMVPLMDGIQTVTAELELTKRAATADERDYASEIKEIEGSIGRSFDDFLANTVSGIGDTTESANEILGNTSLGEVEGSAAASKNVIDKSINSVRVDHLKNVSKQADKQTQIAQNQVSLLEIIADGMGDVEVVSLT